MYYKTALTLKLVFSLVLISCLPQLHHISPVRLNFLSHDSLISATFRISISIHFSFAKVCSLFSSGSFTAQVYADLRISHHRHGNGTNMCLNMYNNR
jgi:hypothetical protein